ncbi:hypothetical protein CCM_02277 [Cordyceps militaris CM01]|uniref:Uncharacterized protein n=1 Tax=Cordyceps militaris (strain CM01) TaxID=983644 RepID=G3J8S1_CORMM|nr:uncharacterized protein CCM_02277 [Cordyceps militaris CM01]EGX94006.1 hypothetical protein CCM_02277 [Cordyceps militaris CM01]
MHSVEGADWVLLKALFWESNKCLKVMDLFRCVQPGLSQITSAELDDVVNQLYLLRRTMIAFADMFPLHTKAIEAHLNHLDMALPSLSVALDVIQRNCDPRYPFDDAIWDRLLYISAGRDNPGLELVDRLKLFTQFFDVLYSALVQDPTFTWRKAEGIRVQIMDLREHEGMRVPSVLKTVFVSFSTLPAARTRRQPPSPPHWAIETVDLNPKIASPFESHGESKSFGPYGRWNQFKIPDNSKLLFRRSFNNDAIALIVFINCHDNMPYLMLRSTIEITPYYDCRPLSAISITRCKTALHLTRWSNRKYCWTLWAVLQFRYFEELVVIHCTLLALKAQSSLLTNVLSPDENVVRDEVKIWERDIKDCGVGHKLAIYRDEMTRTKRLYSYVACGQRLPAYMPAWTIFFTDRGAKPRMECVDDYTVIVHNAVLYKFADRYTTSRHKPRHFEIQFRHPRGKTYIGERGLCVRCLERRGRADYYAENRVMKRILEDLYRQTHKNPR